MQPRSPESRSLAMMIGLCWALVVFGPSARGQPPSPLPPASPLTVQALPPTQPTPTPPTVEQLAERLRALEAVNRNLVGQLEQNQKLHDEQLKQLHERVTELSNRVGNGQEPAAPQSGNGAGEGLPAGNRLGDRGAPVPDYTEGGFAPFVPAPGYPDSNVINPNRFPLRASFGPGFLLQSEDDRFRLQIHYESQIEGRVWGRDDQLPANSGLFLPRQRFFFDGHVTKWVEYELAINRGLNNINLLNAYLNFHLADQVQLRVGRFFTPLPYDQYAISNYWLPTPERSVFTTNLSLNRQIGAMLWGYLFGERLDYAAGVFNGSRNSFESLSPNLDFVGYLNARPFQESETLSFAKFLNVGTSVAVGHQDQSPVPVTFRIAGGSPDANIPGVATVPFLILNPDVIERGERLVGSVHAAYFYKGLSLIGEWQYGFGEYATPTRPSSVHVPYSGFYVTAAYFLTGEEIERRTRVKPLRSLIPVNKDDPRGIGAWEIAARVAQIRLGEQIFTSGFADPSLWSNSATTTEVGLNWYWNEYVKFYVFWLHGEFGSPVQFRPGGFQKSADMFWLRGQLYF
jgi:phosphate-selective porin OprO/OprP